MMNVGGREKVISENQSPKDGKRRKKHPVASGKKKKAMTRKNQEKERLIAIGKIGGSVEITGEYQLFSEKTGEMLHKGIGTIEEARRIARAEDASIVICKLETRFRKVSVTR